MAHLSDRRPNWTRLRLLMERRKWLLIAALAVVTAVTTPLLLSASNDPSDPREPTQTTVPDPEDPPEETDANNAFFNDNIEQLRATGGPYITREQAIAAAGGNRPSITVLFAEFMTFGELRAKTQIEPDIAVGDDREVYLVVLEGNWQAPVPPGVDPITYDHIWNAVDATTGQMFRGGGGKAHLED